MAAISAAEVAKLRKMTGAGMMDCKKALQEAEGNFDKAVEIIRKKGQAVASKRADREAGEGVALAGVSDDGRFGAIIVLNCETDFVAKNADFEKLANDILDKALENKPASLDELKSIKLGDQTIEEKVIEQIGVIGEKLELSYYDFIKAEYVHPYIHPGNKLATIAGFNKSGLDPQVYKDIAMQIAAMNPVAVDKDDVKQEEIDKEIEIGKEQARREGKPDNLLEKIAMGKLGKFFKENTLLNQDYVKDSKQTIKQFLNSVDKDLTVTGFKRYTLNN
ncbi:MAG: translation elongation factor Ts [Bacteroidales bacterium]